MDDRFHERESMSKDKMHPSLKGYQVWADGLKPIFTEKKTPGEFTGLVRPSVALRLRALTLSSCSGSPPRSAQCHTWDFGR